MLNFENEVVLLIGIHISSFANWCEIHKGGIHFRLKKCYLFIDTFIEIVSFEGNCLYFVIMLIEIMLVNFN